MIIDTQDEWCTGHRLKFHASSSARCTHTKRTRIETYRNREEKIKDRHLRTLALFSKKLNAILDTQQERLVARIHK